MTKTIFLSFDEMRQVTHSFYYNGYIPSLATLILIKRHVIMRPTVIFTLKLAYDLPEVWTYFDNVVQPYAQKHNIEIKVIEEPERKLFNKEKKPIMPVYSFKKSMMRGTCYSSFRKSIIFRESNKYIETLKQYLTKDIRWQKIVYWFAIPADAKEQVDKTGGYYYPLIDKEYTLADCKKVIEEEGLPLPILNRCFFCAYQTREEWMELKQKYPEHFQRAAEIEEKFNINTSLAYRKYFTPVRKPLKEVIENENMKIQIERENTNPCFT